MSAEKVRWSFRPPERKVDGDLAQLVAARNSLHEFLEKSREVGYLLHERLQNFQGRLSPVRKALAPVEEESMVSTEISNRIDKATKSIMSVHELYDVAQNLRRIITGEPFLDLDGYLAAVIQLKDALSYHRYESAAAVKSLQEAVNFLETTSTHSRRTERLRLILKDLQAEQASKCTSEPILFQITHMVSSVTS